jgi:prepilin peptidase CpaA
MPMQEQMTWVAFLAFLVSACVFDVRYFRLPNWLMLLGLVVGLALAGSFVGWPGVKASLLGALVGLLPIFVLAAMRLIGMGDAKLMGAIGSFLGPESVLMALLYGAVAGGVLSGVLLATAKPDPTKERKKEKAPYGLALSVGAVVAAVRYGFIGGVA